jgi:hypothetical protein
MPGPLRLRVRSTPETRYLNPDIRRWFRCWLKALNSFQATVKSDRRHRPGHAQTSIISDPSDLRLEHCQPSAKQA